MAKKQKVEETTEPVAEEQVEETTKAAAEEVVEETAQEELYVDKYVYNQGVAMVVNPPAIAIFEKLIEDIKYRGQLIARNQKLDSGVTVSGFKGIVLGFLFAVIMIGLPIVIAGGS
jgi:tetrahydromethanopterin S-methyltransferase subunit F